MLTNDNVSMSVGHLDHVLIAYSSMEHVTWKSRGRQRGTATEQIDKRGSLDQEDTDMHELGRRILPTQPHMGPGDFRSRAPSSCRQSRRDQDVRRTSKRCR